MLPLCPMNLYGRIFGDKSQTNMLPSSLPVIACFLNDLKIKINLLNYMLGLKTQELMELVLPL